jgi:UDP-N-acetylmuramoyl-L-alanyl-D-glutamate--2,6-diaminopimelate ligase
MKPAAAAHRMADLLDHLRDEVGSIPVTGIAYDSRRVQPGNAFFAIPGTVADGATFAAQAVKQGASVVIAQRPLELDIPVVVVDDPRRAMAAASSRFWAHPDRDVKLIGVVGTNGKSTVAAGLERVCSNGRIPAGLIGTLEYRWGETAIRAQRTTPESPDLFEMLAQMRTDRIAVAAVEVSSHAIALDRIWSVSFSGGIFTNLTRDHLDFHKTMEEYRRVKGRFFERLEDPDTFAAINADDPAANYFIKASQGARIIRYAARNQDADVALDVTSHSLDGTRGSLIIEGKLWPLSSKLWGGFNHANLAAIAAGAYGCGLSPATIAEGIASFSGIPGRAERIPSTAPFNVFVDYAHTPDALDAVLSAARPLVKGRLLVVFGCGGDRDRGKRPEMAQAVERWADAIYLTSDNPRSEDPMQIIEDTKKGFSTEAHIWCDPNRTSAVERSIADANAGDAVFLCGKGHEETQDIGGVLHRFSDRERAAQVLAAKGHGPQAPEGGGIPPDSAVGPGGDPSPTRP